MIKRGESLIVEMSHSLLRVYPPRNVLAMAQIRIAASDSTKCLDKSRSRPLRQLEIIRFFLGVTDADLAIPYGRVCLRGFSTFPDPSWRLKTPQPPECGRASAEAEARIRCASTNLGRLETLDVKCICSAHSPASRRKDPPARTPTLPPQAMWVVYLLVIEYRAKRLQRTLPLLAAIATPFLAKRKLSALEHVLLRGSLPGAFAVKFPTSQQAWT
ncbi:hypothetical protein V8E53_008678 [Lactarius tabidus]